MDRLGGRYLRSRVPGGGPADCGADAVPPGVPPGTRVYALGDCHGCLAALRGLRAAIVADSARADARGPRADRRVVVYLGDYIDRGPDSRGVVELLIGEPLAGFESVHLLGNHELFLLRFLDGEDDASVWMMNGGPATLRSYGLDARGVGPRTGGDASRLRDALTAAVPAAHRAFLDGLALSHLEGDYFFVHAGVRPGVPLAAQEADDLLWIREPFLGSTADHGKVVVHGHSTTTEVTVRANRIGIDTGACYGGNLTALVLEGSRRRFLSV
jgi:serine/threonine protein phosphatase 1